MRIGKLATCLVSLSVLPAKSLPLPTILRRVQPCILRTDLVAMCADCDSPVGWRSAPATATHIGGQAHGIMSHNCLSVSILLVIFSLTCSNNRSGCQHGDASWLPYLRAQFIDVVWLCLGSVPHTSLAFVLLNASDSSHFGEDTIRPETNCSCECAVPRLCPRISISNVVVFVTIHDDMFLYVHIYKRCLPK